MSRPGLGEHGGQETHSPKRKPTTHGSPLLAFIILVIDSTDRDRLLTAQEELFKMLGHEVSPLKLGEGPAY